MSTEQRRDFLKKSIFGAATLTVPSAMITKNTRGDDSSVAVTPFSTDPTALVNLTDTIKCTRIGFGTGMIGYNQSSELTRMDHEEALKVLGFAYDNGIRFFDMADLYGTHSIVSEYLAGKPRDEYTLVSKYWPHPGGIPDEVRGSVDEVVKRFLKELKTDYIDVVQIHCMSDPDWDTKLAAEMEALERLKEQGLIRAHGISTHSVAAVRRGAELDWTDVMHVRINTTGARMDGTLEENLDVFNLAHQNGKGLIAMKIIGEGTIKDPEERRRSVDLTLRVPAIDVLVVGFLACSEISEFLTNVEASLKEMEKELQKA